MTFWSAQCELCRQYFHKAEELMAFRIKDKQLVQVQLNGEQSWSGIRCVCNQCGTTIARAGGWLT